MAKITQLPILPANQVTGTETLPIVKNGQTSQVSTAVLMDRLTNFSSGFEADECGYGMVAVGANGRVIFGTNLNNRFGAEKMETEDLNATLATIGAFNLGGVTVTAKVGYEADECGSDVVLVGSNGRVIGGGADASVAPERYETAVNAGGDLAWLVDDAQGNRQIKAWNAKTFRTVQLTSAGDNGALVVTPDRKVISTVISAGSPVRRWFPISGGESWPVEPTDQITVHSDSLGATNSGVRTNLAAALPTRTINFEPIGGQREHQIVGRAGALPQTAIFTGNSVPISGTVVVTGTDLLTTALGTSFSLRIRVYGADGVSFRDGELRRTAAGDPIVNTYLFAPDAGASAAMAVPSPAAIEVISGLTLNGATVIAAKSMRTLLTGASILIAGTNDVGKPDFDIAKIEAYDQAWLQNQRTIVKHPLIVGLYGFPSWGIEDAFYRDAKLINDMRRAKWGDWRDGGIFVDWQDAVNRSGWGEAVTTSGGTYSRARADFTQDGGHPGDAGKVVLTTAITDAITAKGF